MGICLKVAKHSFCRLWPSSCLIYIVYHQRFIVIGAPAWVHRGGGGHYLELCNVLVCTCARENRKRPVGDSAGFTEACSQISISIFYFFIFLCHFWETIHALQIYTLIFIQMQESSGFVFFKKGDVIRPSQILQVKVAEETEHRAD